MSSQDDDGVVSHSMTFEVGPNTREVHDDAVEAFDSALVSVGTGEVMHFMDPRRINAFSSGGPPVWSVAAVPVDQGAVYLTYGLSEAIDPSRRNCGFEMSIRVTGSPTVWPALLLRALCRYMIQSGRVLEVGQAMPFPDSITRFFAPEAERHALPESAMNNACFTRDPLLPTIETPHGAIEVRRAFGLYPDEAQLMELWSVAGYVQTIANSDPTLTTDLDRDSHASDAEFVGHIEAGSARDGSAVGYVATPGVTWSNDNGSLQVLLPGGVGARRIHRMLAARMPFGNHLLVHDVDPANQLAVAFEPSETPAIRVEGPTLVVSLPPDHELIASLANAADGTLTWNLT